jgi:hypothetical protein
MIWPAAFFIAGSLAVVLMERAIGKNLGNAIRQAFFMPMDPRPSPDAGVWFWIAVACFVLGTVCFWRAFKRIRRASRDQQIEATNERQ